MNFVEILNNSLSVSGNIYEEDDFEYCNCRFQYDNPVSFNSTRSTGKEGVPSTQTQHGKK
ncbi:MAG: hypothetical protein IJ566_01550 [Cardiobacteriaceae bacterium]|nr:hypothetical protein [Cardiobacteriaceae bacterium]